MTGSTATALQRAARHLLAVAGGAGARATSAGIAGSVGASGCSSSGAAAPQQLQLLRTFAVRSAAAGPAAAAANTNNSSSLSPFRRWWRDFSLAPTAARVLGLAGAAPFIALAEPVAPHLSGLLPAVVVEHAAELQVGYGALIVSFLGGVHWGFALGGSSALAAAGGARVANEFLVWSVTPCLMAWPTLAMEPGAGAMVQSLLLPTLYVVDAGRRNFWPVWYMALRAPLTLLATFGVLLTATRTVHAQLDRAREQEAEAQRAKGAGAAGGAAAATVTQ